MTIYVIITWVNRGGFMKKNLVKFVLIPIPYVVVLIGFLIFGDDSFDEVISFLLVFVGASIIMLMALVNSPEQYDTKKWFNANKIKNLEEDIYGHYAEITKQFTFGYIPGKEKVIVVGDMDKLRLEHFIVAVVKHQKFLPLYKHRFETINHSDGMYYQLMHIYALYYLLENDITKFQIHYKLYKNTIDLRSESRVLHEKLHRIMFGKDYYDIPIQLLDTMYEYYVLDKAIDHEILKYSPKCPLDEMIYMTILYHYLDASENNKLLTDIAEEYKRYKEIRKNL